MTLTSQDFEASIDTLNFSTLFSYYQQTNDLEQKKLIEKLLDDSIPIYKDYVLIGNDKIDSTHKTIKLHFEFDKSFFESDYSIKWRNVYLFELTKHDSIYVRGEKTEQIDTLNTSIREFITNPNNLPFLPEKRIKVINHFDTVWISRHGFFIHCVLVPDSFDIRTSWKTLAKTINIIVYNYYDLRNELAIKKWEMEYNKLDFDKKVSIALYYPIKIWIFLNRQRVKPPPPPPPKDENIRKILEDDEIELKLE